MTTPERIAEIINADPLLVGGCKTALCELVEAAYRQLTTGTGRGIGITERPEQVTMIIDRRPGEDVFSVSI